eukprot:scaffold5364_cov164-Amphora_coffeaeformis.AAC.29
MDPVVPKTRKRRLNTSDLAESDGMLSRCAERQATLDLMNTATPLDAIFVGKDHMGLPLISLPIWNIWWAAEKTPDCVQYMLCTFLDMVDSGINE